MARVSLDLLQQFVQVARLGNLSRAAEQANLTVSALSHQVKQLEQRLERKLFERGPRGVHLTAEGRRLLESVGPHFEGIDRALVGFRCRRDDVLTLSAIPGMMSSWLVPRLARLVAAHPELQLNLQSSVELVNFERDPVDAAVRYGRGSWPGLITERLFGEWIAPVAAPSLMERMSELDPNDLSQWPLLGDPGDRWRDWFADGDAELPRRYVAHFDNTDALQRGAMEGMGVALGRMVLARPLIEAGQLKVLGDRYQQIPEAYFLVYPEHAKDHAGLRTFREWLLCEAGKYSEAMSYATASNG
jgi:LysR family glycine cleavage system transcriptional activator